MANSRLNTAFEHIFSLNLSLLEMARAGSWEAFSTVAEDYVIRLNQLMQEQQTLDYPEREELKQMLQRLLVNENEMVQALNHRLGALKQEMSTLGRGKECTQAYASILKSTVH